MAYIYLITNTINNKKYVGKTVTSISERYSKHIWQANNESNKTALHYAMNKYGINNFLVEEIEQCDLNSSSEREQYWISMYDSYNNGYNETIGGEGNPKFNYAEIYSFFLKGLNQTEIANQLGCERHTVARALKAYDVTENERKRGKFGNAKQGVVQINLINNQILQRFPSLTAAANYENCSVGMMSLVCNNKRKLKNKNYTYQKEKVINV